MTPETNVVQDQALALETRLFNYQEAKKGLLSLISGHNKIIAQARRDRTLRRLDLDVDELRAKNLLESDETLIPVRVIDTNIKREQPSLVAFFTQSHRAAVFKPRNPLINSSNLEKAFTDGVRYSGWEIPFYKCIDGAQLHGRDSIELEFDETKPFKIGYAHIGYENLIFPDGVQRLEDCEQIIIRYEGQTPYSLKEKVEKYGFDRTQVMDNLIKDFNTASVNNKTFTIFKLYFKHEGIVHVAWFAEECDDWLRVPQPLHLGRVKKEITLVPSTQTLITGETVTLPVEQEVEVPVYETVFPVKLYIYKLTEDKSIYNTRGRAFEDEYKQVAQTALWTSFVNGSVRASNVYASPQGDDSSGAPLSQLDLKIEHGKIYNRQINFWHTDYPPLQVIDAASRLDIQTQNEAGQIAYTVLNRRDTEKTATELNLAKEQSNLLSSVQVTLLASFFRDVYSHTWLIVQSLAASGKITIPGVPPEEIAEFYEIETAGSVDVVERAQRLQNRLQVWPIVSQTPLSQAFLLDILKEMFPKDVQRYEQILMASQQKSEMIRNLSNVLGSIVMDNNNQIKPEFAPYAEQLTQLFTQAAQVQQLPTA